EAKGSTACAARGGYEHEMRAVRTPGGPQAMSVLPEHSRSRAAAGRGRNRGSASRAVVADHYAVSSRAQSVRGSRAGADGDSPQAAISAADGTREDATAGEGAAGAAARG